MPGFMYRRSFFYRNTAVVLLFLALICAGWKVFSVLQSIQLYDQAEKLRAAGKLMDAEDAYLHALAVSDFDYRRAEIASALAALQPETRMIRTVSSLKTSVASSAASLDVRGLVKAYNDYTEAQKESAAQGEEAAKRFAELAAEARIDRT
ncbi:hypothetical protein LJK87_17780 [Paenibacillus sp. P25]|nr:hypothetical protein LJK87_17780 [Paenibacillus sp. P25]